MNHPTTQLRMLRAAFTLPEMTLSMSIVGLLMLGVVSSIMVGSAAIPEPDDPIEKAVKNAGVADNIAEELRYATAITERSDNAIAFLVADRDGDRVQESIRYAWSGTAGDVLTREYKGSTVAVAHDVDAFHLDYKTITIDETYPGASSETAEAILFASPEGGVVQDFKPRRDESIGQYFMPTGLPTGTTSWSVTEIAFEARSDGRASGSTRVQLQKADANMRPTGVVLEEFIMDEGALRSSYEWEQFYPTQVVGLDPNEGLCLVLERASGGTSCAVKDQISLWGGQVWTINDGFFWNYEPNRSMICAIKGKAQIDGPPQTASRVHVTAVRVSLQSGKQTGDRQVTTTPTLNNPEVLSAFWELRFDVDPRLDHNGSGQADWVNSAGTFSPGSLVNEVWQVDSELETYPANDFADLTTIEMRARTIANGMGAALWIFADANGSDSGLITASLDRMADGTQTLNLSYKTTATNVPLASVPNLPDDFVTIRLVIDPDLDTVAGWVGGVHIGTFNYLVYSFGSGNRHAAITSLGATADIDSVSIRVSGE